MEFPKPLTLLANSKKPQQSFICFPHETVFSDQNTTEPSWITTSEQWVNENKWITVHWKEKVKLFIQRRHHCCAVSGQRTSSASQEMQKTLWCARTSLVKTLHLRMSGQFQGLEEIFPLICCCRANTFHRHAGRNPSFVLWDGEHGGKQTFLNYCLMWSDCRIRTLWWQRSSRLRFTSSFRCQVFCASLLCPVCKYFPPKPIKNCLNSIQSPVSTLGLQSVPMNWIHGMLCLLIIVLPEHPERLEDVGCYGHKDSMKVENPTIIYGCTNGLVGLFCSILSSPVWQRGVQNTNISVELHLVNILEDISPLQYWMCIHGFFP